MADLYYDLQGNNSAGVPGVGILSVQATLDLVLSTSWINRPISTTLLQVEAGLYCSFDEGIVIDVSPFDFKLVVSTEISHVNVDQGTVGPALVKWSNIGSIDFTIGKDNIAGERPLDWFGYVFDLRKLGNKVVAYGVNGVSFLIPVSNAYGLETIYRVGLKGKRAVTGDNTKHFFIDKIGQLWRVDESLNKLDYSEYLSLMSSSLIMTYDHVNNLVYICDGVYGFVYNHSNGSFGSGPVDVTGFGFKNGNAYISSSGSLEIPKFEICTDVYDLGTNYAKVLTSIEFAIDSSESLQARVEYRDDIDGEFSNTEWKNVSDSGKVVIPCYGREFRIRLRSNENGEFKLDNINVYGNLNVIGELPVNWERVECVKRLNNNVILYCDNGVFSFDGENTLLLHGLPLINKTCVCGNDLSHFFIDSKNKLFKLSNNLELLDYSEYLSTLTNPSMVYDEDNMYAYICDGNNGFIYSDGSKSLGKGYGNLTGFYSSFNNVYVCKSDKRLVGGYAFDPDASYVIGCEAQIMLRLEDSWTMSTAAVFNRNADLCLVAGTQIRYLGNADFTLDLGQALDKTFIDLTLNVFAEIGYTPPGEPDQISSDFGTFNAERIPIKSNTLFTLPDFEICTDIYDLGNRKLKTIHSIEIGTDVNTGLLVSIEYRQDHKAEFSQIPWFIVTRDGISYVNCTGTEFKFKIKSTSRKYFEIDYLKIHGTIHSYSIDDSFKNPTF